MEEKSREKERRRSGELRLGSSVVACCVDMGCGAVAGRLPRCSRTRRPWPWRSFGWSSRSRSRSWTSWPPRWPTPSPSGSGSD